MMPWPAIVITAVVSFAMGAGSVVIAERKSRDFMNIERRRVQRERIQSSIYPYIVSRGGYHVTSQRRIPERGRNAGSR